MHTYHCSLPGFNIHTLPNGLRIIHHHSDASVVYCGYAIGAGTRHEQDDEGGMAHFCEHTTFKGTLHRKSWHILNALERVGGDINAFTNKEETVYYAAIEKHHVKKAVDLLTDIVFYSVYPQNELNKEMVVIAEEIDSYNDSPAELIYDRFESQLFGSHSLGRNILGEVESLQTFTTQKTKTFAVRHYHPANMVFFIDGDVSFDQVVQQIEKLSPPTVEPFVPYNCEAPTAYQASHEILRKDTHQAHLMLGNRALAINDMGRFALLLLNNILGGSGMNTRLNLALRERRGLVYTVDSSLTAYSDTGTWAVYLGCDPKDVKKCRKIVRSELDKLIHTPLTANQLQTAKKQLRGQIAIAMDNRESFAIDMGKYYLRHHRVKDPQQLMTHIEQVSSEQLQEMAHRIYNEEQTSSLLIV